MPTPKRTSAKSKAVAATVSAPVISKKKSESHIPTAAVMWIAVLAVVFSFTGITLSAMAKNTPTQRTGPTYDVKTEFTAISQRLERIEQKIDALKTTSTQQ